MRRLSAQHPCWGLAPLGYEPDTQHVHQSVPRDPDNVMSYREEHKYYELLDTLIDEYEEHPALH